MKPIAKLTGLAGVLILSACASTPTGPSVLVLQGSDKSFEQFMRDDVYCRDFSLRQIGGKGPGHAGQDAGVASAVAGTVIGAAAGAAIGGHNGAGVGAGTGLIVGSMAGNDSGYYSTYSSQQQYDNAYIQCMYGAGHRVPVPAGLYSTERSNSPTPPPPPPRPAQN
jgi:hypothetical protein